MDEKEIIEAARKAGVAKYGLGWTAWEGQLERFARLIEAKTLERAAKAGELIDWAIEVCDAAKNLVAQKGRHNTEIAYKRLEEAVKKGE